MLSVEAFTFFLRACFFSLICYVACSLFFVQLGKTRAHRIQHNSEQRLFQHTKMQMCKKQHTNTKTHKKHRRATLTNFHHIGKAQYFFYSRNDLHEDKAHKKNLHKHTHTHTHTYNIHVLYINDIYMCLKTNVTTATKKRNLYLITYLINYLLTYSLACLLTC